MMRNYKRNLLQVIYYKLLPKRYYLELCYFDNDPKKFKYDDDYIMNAVAQQCNVSKEIVKKCVDIYYDALIEKMMREKAIIGYLQNPYLYMVINNTHPLQNISDMIHFNMIKTIKNLNTIIVKYLKKIKSISEIKNEVQSIEKMLLKFYTFYAYYKFKKIMLKHPNFILLSNKKDYYYITGYYSMMYLCSVYNYNNKIKKIKNERYEELDIDV